MSSKLIFSGTLPDGVRFDGTAQGPRGPIPNVTVTVCTSTATGLPCSPTATTYTDITLSTPCAIGNQVTLTNSNVCQATGDGLGNFGFWLAPGTYKYSITGPSIVGQLFKLTVPAGSDDAGNMQTNSIASLTILNLSRDCRIDGTLDLTGATDSSAIINTCIANAITNKESTIQLPCGKFLINTALNFTNRPGLRFKGCAPAQFQLSSQNPIAGVGQTVLLCNTGGVCVDHTGSSDTDIADMQLWMGFTGATSSSTVGFLRGRDNAGGGGGGNPFCFAQHFSMKNLSVIDFSGTLNVTANGGRGYIGFYDYAGETGVIENMFIHTGAPMVFTNTNVASVTSPYQTLGTGCPSTMTTMKIVNSQLDASTSTSPTFECDQCVDFTLESVVWIGGGAAMKFEGTSANKFHIIGRYDSSPNSPVYFLTTTTSVRDSFFHIEAFNPLTAYVNPAANNIFFENDFWWLNSDVPAASPFCTNTATGIQSFAGVLVVPGAASCSNWQLVGTQVFAPQNNSANISFAGSSSYFLTSSINEQVFNNMFMKLTSGSSLNISSGATINPTTAAAVDIGTAALPFANLWLGTAATNNFKFAPAATAAARTITISDPLGNTNLPLTIASGTKALNTASITTATCDAGIAATATGTLATDTVDWSFNAAPNATNKYGAFLVVYAVPSANTVTFYTCNPSATTSTPTAMTVNWSVRRP